MVFTSGTQARDGRAVNHDPQPYRCVDWNWCTNHVDGPCWAAESNRHNCQRDPHLEFAVLDNPILAVFRHAGTFLGSEPVLTRSSSFLAELNAGRVPFAATDATTEQIRHARRVLGRLTALRS